MYFFSLLYIRMIGKSVNFDDKKIEKSELYKNKKVFQIDDIDVNEILVPKKEPYGSKKALKYFFGYNGNDVIRPLCLRLTQMTGYARKFDKNVTMSFRVTNNNKLLLKNCNKIWEKIEKLMRIDFESKPVYGDDDKYVKTKIKIYAGSMITNFLNKKMPKEKVSCKCLSIIMLDSVIKVNKKYYPQTFFKNVNICKKR